MASLTAHLLETGDHGRLGFHSSCPVCRQDRLLGPLSSEPLISLRARAALASGVLALSAAGPPAAFAVEPDLQNEGGLIPGQPPPDDLDRPGFDPGGDTALPFETPPAPAPPSDGGASDTEDSTPLESEPAEDPDVPSVDTPGFEAPSVPSGDDTGVPPAPPVSAPDRSVPSDGAAPPHPAAGEEAPRADTPRERGATERDRQPDGKKPGASRPGQEATGTPSPTLAVATSPPAEPTQATSSAVETATDLAAAEPERKGITRFFVVQSGDSLWSIAKRLLGPDATPAQIAREVARLWSLNEDRIGTGDPDLLAVGTKLRLR